MSEAYRLGCKLIEDVRQGVDSPEANITRAYIEAEKSMAKLLKAIKDNNGAYDETWKHAWKVWSDLQDWAGDRLGVMWSPNDHGAYSLAVFLKSTPEMPPKGKP